MAAKPIDPFDMDALRLTPEQAAKLMQRQSKTGPTAASADGRPHQGRGFVMMTHDSAKAAFHALGCPQASCGITCSIECGPAAIGRFCCRTWLLPSGACPGGPSTGRSRNWRRRDLSELNGEHGRVHSSPC
jgi:hypothetical protein